jgi:hypothetical protein
MKRHVLMTLSLAFLLHSKFESAVDFDHEYPDPSNQELQPAALPDDS